MNIIKILLFTYLLFLLTTSYKYINSYKWKIIRKILINKNIKLNEKNKIKKFIFDKYKIRTLNKINNYILLKKKFIKIWIMNN